MGRLTKLTQSDYAFSLFQKCMNIITGILTISLINRYLGTTLKGEYEYILNIVNVLSIILGFGLHASYPYMKRNKMQNQLKSYLDIFFLQAMIYMLIGAAIVILTQEAVVAMAVILTVARIANSQMQEIGVVEFIRFRQVLQIVSYLIDFLLTLVVYLFIPQNMHILLSVLAVKYVIYIVAYLLRCEYIPKPFQANCKIAGFLFRFGFFAMLTALLSEFNYSIDIIVMKRFLPFSEIGLYSVGSKLAQYIWLIPDAFKEVLFSHTAKDDSINEIKEVMRINIFVTLVMILVMLVLGKLIIFILYGEEYLDSYSITAVIFLWIPSMVIYKLLNPLYMANGRQKTCFFTLLASVLINVMLNFLVIPYYGKMGAAVSTVISYTVCGMFFFIGFIKTYHLRWKDCLWIKKSDFSKLYKMACSMIKKS